MERTAERWKLNLEPPFASGGASLTMPGTDQQGAGIVLKLQFPHRECEHEAEALRQWAGSGAVRLLAHDPDEHALLLERCEPGEPLSDADADTAVEALIQLVTSLSIPAGTPFVHLIDEAASWRESLLVERVEAQRSMSPSLVDSALAAIDSLVATARDVPSFLLHQDLHGENVINGRGGEWLAIDPKPLVGDPAFAVAPIVRSPELGHDRDQVLHRLDRLTTGLELDRERARLWTIAQTSALALWFDDPEYRQRFVDVATWLVEDRA